MNPKALRALSSADPIMADLIARVGPMKLEPRRLTPYQSLVRSIIYQQLSGRAAETILGRFCALFPNCEFPSPDHLLQSPPERLRSAGLSGAKTRYVQGLAERAKAGLVPAIEDCDALTDQEIIERLTEIKGIGRWTVEMLLIFNLGRPDVLPVGDLGVRRGFQLAYGKRKMPEEAQLARYGERWRPHRTVAAWYLWRAVDLHREKRP